MIATIISLVTFFFLLYIKYRFHIQFILLLRKFYKWANRPTRTTGPQ